jgi:hypothetical protein
VVVGQVAALHEDVDQPLQLPRVIRELRPIRELEREALHHGRQLGRDLGRLVGVHPRSVRQLRATISIRRSPNMRLTSGSDVHYSLGSPWKQ